jgi:hypothetical protein
MKDKIIIANASGFWGDEAAAVRRQVLGGPIDYLTMDYLAEITMIILGKQRADNEALGYAKDFVTHVGGVLAEIAERGITVIANAGGMNPVACARAIEALVEQAGLDLPVAIVDGDDLMPRLTEIAAASGGFPHLETGDPIGDRLALVNTANAYIGARPIVAALQRGARIVVTGRTYDAASVVAPFVHEFGWNWNEWDRLAGALLAGHLIECGSQVTGGNYTLWREVASYENMGYPLVEAAPDGSFVLTKHPRTGGIVNTRTATEQTLYEIGDPRAYASPDVTADFTSFTMEQVGEDRVRVSGTRGSAPSDRLKVSMTYPAGYKIQCAVLVSGPDAVAKADKFAEIYWNRVHEEFLETRTDIIGATGCWGESGSPRVDPNEVMLRFSARAADPAPLGRMAKQLAGIALAGPAGICGAGARPSVSAAIAYWPALIPKKLVSARVLAGGEVSELACDLGESAPPVGASSDLGPRAGGSAEVSGERLTVPLSRIAHGRSGDKGDICNVGLAALRPEFYPVLLEQVTVARVAELYSSTVKGKVERYRLDNLNAVNFVMRGALGGGGTVSLLVDTQGKTMAQGLMMLPVDVPAELLQEAAK